MLHPWERCTEAWRPLSAKATAKLRSRANLQIFLDISYLHFAFCLTTNYYRFWVEALLGASFDANVNAGTAPLTDAEAGVAEIPKYASTPLEAA